MNVRQYKRLLIISFIPLLVLGYFSAGYIFHRSGMEYQYILCAPFYSIENCRQVGPSDGFLYKSVKSDHSVWFDVSLGDVDENAPLYNFVEASMRIVPEAKIIDASPFRGDHRDVSTLMRSFVGSSATVVLGIPQGRESIMLNRMNRLYCNSLEFQSDDGEYRSRCFGDNWSGIITYRVDGDSRNELDQLLESINAQIASRNFDYNIFRIVFYPMFVYLFLLASLLAWIIAKAVRYVKAG